ncbi:hypothetical protein [Micromonospora chokoriensis]|nr:hypothetical protein [Micromonospora chokoriensis]
MVLHVRLRAAGRRPAAEGARMPPTWLLALSWAALAAGFVSTG